MHGVGALFRQRSQEIERAADGATQRVEDVRTQFDKESRDFTNAMAAAADRAERIVETMSNQARELIEASSYASAEAEKVRINTLEAARDQFLRESRLVVDELSSLGSRGDKSVFLRSMLDNGDAKRIQDEIKSHDELNGEFRVYADRYLEKFEGLLTQATRSDPANLLSSAFVTSDMGKVYVLLSRAVGRMN
jgi:cell division septum initiation protein DivIVA